MALNVTGNFGVSANVTETISNGLGVGSLGPALSVSLAFGAGVGAGNIGQVWSKSDTATAAPVTYTLSALVDDLGRTIPIAKVRGIIVANLATVDGRTLTIGGAASHPWLAPFGDVSDKAVVQASGFWAMAAPLAAGMGVTSGSSDQLKLDPGSNTVPFKTFFVGE